MSERKSIVQKMTYTVEMDAPLIVRREKGVLVQGDKNANAFVVNIFEKKGLPADLTGCKATLIFVRPDNVEALPINAEISENTVTAVLTETCYRVSGVYAAMVSISKDGAERTILKTIGDMISTENDGVVDEEQIFPTPEELLETLAQVEEARDTANEAAENANKAAGNADAATGNANEAAYTANAAARKIDGMTVSAESADEARAEISEKNGAKHISFSLPRGEKGEKGDPGPAGIGNGTVTAVTVNGTKYEPDDTGNVDVGEISGGGDGTVTSVCGILPDETGNVTLNADDVGARQNSWTPTASEVGALPIDGTAVDSSKMGGKTPEHYTPYENRADNSNFCQWVAQAGVGGSHGVQAYGGDRWILDSGTIAGTQNSSGDGYGSITLNGTIRQIVAKPQQIMTAFVGMISGTAEVAYSYAGGTGELTITSAGGVLDWVLLLPGEWSETPPYVPKGYAVELAECQRYLVPIGGAPVYGYLWGSGALYANVPIPANMRVTPSLSKELKINITHNGTQKSISGWSISASYPGCLEIKSPSESNGLGTTPAAVGGYISTTIIYASADL